MLKQLQHSRFKMQCDYLSLTESYWYAQKNIPAPVGTGNDNNHQRPDCILTGA
jgi:hypothetical protein